MPGAGSQNPTTSFGGRWDARDTGPSPCAAVCGATARARGPGRPTLNSRPARARAVLAVTRGGGGCRLRPSGHSGTEQWSVRPQGSNQVKMESREGLINVVYKHSASKRSKTG